MSKTKNPAGPWEPLFLVKQTKGWIDPCPLWDDDGNAYLVHAWAKSRVGFNSILNVNRMSVDGKNIFNDSATVFDGHKSHPTIEGPKFYKRNGYYYIFAPAGGVPTGWQTVLRSKNVFGPYEDKIVLAQGTTTINGPHQGGWIETQTGESWFVHFQDRGPYGRIIHLQPVKWNNDWPVIGLDTKGTGRGEPVLSWKKPNVRKTYPIAVPQTSDKFDSAGLGLQWQWHANHSNQWYSLKEQKGILRLHSLPVPKSYKNLMDVPNLLLQKFPAPAFTVTTQVSFNPASDGEKTGLLIMGNDYAYIAVVKRADGFYLIKTVCTNADKGNAETEETKISLPGNSLLLRVIVDTEAICRFYYSNDSKTFKLLGLDFVARKSLWIGAKVGLFAIASSDSASIGFADYDWCRIE
jgi:beta-xylosidase